MQVKAQASATFVTLADARYFPGTVALVNSLRLAGNPEPIVVVDTGLTEGQRELLLTTCEIQSLPLDRDGSLTSFLKPAIRVLGLTGTVVFLDSDMIITDRLDQLLDEAATGQVCAFVDGLPQRRFDEWVSVLGLERAPRDQAYVNAGCLALRTDLWDDLLRRWWELCDRVRAKRSALPHDIPEAEAAVHPFAYQDQDVLNALLMTEVPEERISFLDPGRTATPTDNRTTRIEDRAQLRCTKDGRTTVLLHYWDHPKPWFPGARPELHFDAYVELMARLLTLGDVPVQLRGRDLPVWLRETPRGRLVRRGPIVARQMARSGISHLPGPLRRRIRQLRARAAK